MEVQNQSAFTSSQNSSCSSPPEVLTPENHDDSLIHNTPLLGTVIPNRIFVGGIDYKVNESDLRHVFSQHGAVKEVKIVIDRAGMSKGYGFVTFETQDDALKILHNANGICFKDKKLSIGQAVRKQQPSVQTKSTPVAFPNSAMPVPMSCGTVYLTTSTGNPYTYHNGVAYFHCPNMNPPGRHWPSPPVMLSQSHQPVYQQPAHHHYQCVPNQYQWSVVKSPMPSSPVMYSQQSEYLYQPAHGGSVQPSLPVMEDTTPEFIEPTLQQVYPLYPQRSEGMTPIVLQHDPGKNPMFPHSQVHLKPKYRQYIHHKDYHYLPETMEPPDASMLHPSHPLIVKIFRDPLIHCLIGHHWKKYYLLQFFSVMM
ncbi:protein boule-like isoform X2 [Micropterus salmoides]|uniref:protein boule-like isoform X2 n=1 Tax=Micropterus salmoides TaxID=27706 RepID=UPI0018EA9B30|nr:protein boule-like isoform X2 [Micropterus salmoides]